MCKAADGLAAVGRQKRDLKGTFSLLMYGSTEALLKCGTSDAMQKTPKLRCEGLPTFAVACSSDSVGTTITLSPWVQLTGVATEWLAVSCSESMTRRICATFTPQLSRRCLQQEQPPETMSTCEFHSLFCPPSKNCSSGFRTTRLYFSGRLRQSSLPRVSDRPDPLDGPPTRAHLREVAASGGGVEDGQLQALVRANDENSASSQRNASLVLLIWVQHAIPASDKSDFRFFKEV